MFNWKEILISPTTPIINTMKVINQTAMQFAVVVDQDNRLLGTITDGDIRRGLLKGMDLQTPISEAMNHYPIYAEEGKKIRHYKRIIKENHLKQLPIVNKSMEIRNVIFEDDSSLLEKENQVILMVGGLGTRLRPLTNELPKPMLHVGGKPILETIIEGYKEYGFIHFVLSVNYKKEIIMDYFKDGSEWGVHITYIEEDKKLGTAGALSLLKEKPTCPFLVMNGDLLTKINYDKLLNFHKENQSVGTMCVREYEYQIPYGVIETENQQLLSIVEKPVKKSFVNAGVYVLSPEILDFIPYDRFYDMPDLFKLLIEKKRNITAFPISEYWMDIGRIADYEKASGEFINYFSNGEKW